MKRLLRLAKKNRETDPESFGQFYESLVISRIRKRYSVDQELAIMRQQNKKPAEFAAYDAFVEQCKAEVKRELELN